MSLTLAQQKHNIDFKLKSLSNEIAKISAQDLVPDLLDPHYFGFLKSNPQNMRIHGSGYKGQNSNQNYKQKSLLSKAKSELSKKTELSKIFLSLNGSCLVF